MTNTKSRKVIALITAAIMLVGVTIVGTLAYLTDKDGPVTNTFTAGNVDIDLDEAKTNEYGQLLDKEGDIYTGAEGQEKADRVKANAYTLVPGHEYTKDPIVHVTKGSEKSYIFVKVNDGISAIQAETTVVKQMKAKGWEVLNSEKGIFYYENIVDAKAAAKDVPVFDDFTVSGDVTNDGLKAYNNATITVEAYAVQADGFANATTAWEAAPLDAWLA